MQLHKAEVNNRSLCNVRMVSGAGGNEDDMRVASVPSDFFTTNMVSPLSVSISVTLSFPITSTTWASRPMIVRLSTKANTRDFFISYSFVYIMVAINRGYRLKSPNRSNKKWGDFTIDFNISSGEELNSDIL